MRKHTRSNSRIDAESVKTFEPPTSSNIRQDSRNTPTRFEPYRPKPVEGLKRSEYLSPLGARKAIVDRALVNLPPAEQAFVKARTRSAATSARPSVIQASVRPSQSTRNTLHQTPTLRQMVNSGDIHRALTCFARTVRREIVFANGGGGSRKRYPDRKPPSKVKC